MKKSLFNFLSSLKVKLVVLIVVATLPVTVLQIYSIQQNYKDGISQQILANEELAELLGITFDKFIKWVFT